MSDAAARSKSVRLALAFAAVLIALGALAWWMRDARDKPPDVAVQSRAKTIEEPALDLDLTSVEPFDVSVASARRAEEPVAVVAPAAQASVEWGRLHLTVRSTDPRLNLTRGTAYLSARALRSREQLKTLDPSKHSSFYDGSLDANGRVEFNQLPFGDWDLEVKAEGFDLVERRLIIERGPIMNLELAVDPVAITELAVVLRHPNGIPLFDAVEGELLETAKALRLAFVVECPPIGSDLPAAARRLVQRSRFVREEHPDQWMLATFKQPVTGCVCVLLAERVLDAVPFSAGQGSVVLRVRPEDLLVHGSSIAIVVIDEVTAEPISGARVSMREEAGRERTRVTDASGTIAVADLLPGQLRIRVEAEGHAWLERTVVVEEHAAAGAQTFALTPHHWIRGRVQFPPSGPVEFDIVVEPIVRPTFDLQWYARLQKTADGGFEKGPLRPAEYLVGILAPGLVRPDPDQVRRGDANGWRIVDLRRGSVEGLSLMITEDVASASRAEQRRTRGSASR